MILLRKAKQPEDIWMVHLGIAVEEAHILPLNDPFPVWLGEGKGRKTDTDK